MIPFALDIISTIITAITAFLLVGTAIAVALAYLLYRALRSLTPMQRNALLALLVVAGLLLMVSLIGIEIGFTLELIAGFVAVFDVIGGKGLPELG